jgi:xylulokinase
MHNRYVNGDAEAAVLGIDLGTSGVKVLVTTPGGDVLGRAMAGYPVSVPAPGQAEADPGNWWAATRRAVHAALARPRTSPSGVVTRTLTPLVPRSIPRTAASP